MTDKNFFTSLFYLILISMATLVIWYFNLENIGMLVYVGIILLLLIFVKNSLYVLPFLLNMLFMISQTEWSLSDIPIYLYIGPAALIIGILIHTFRFKVNLFNGQFFIGISLLGIAMIISTIVNSDSYDINTIFIFVVAIFFVFLYGFFANTLEGENLIYLLKIFSVLGFLISIQVAIFYLREPDIILAIESKKLDLGWGISNFVATYMIIFISATVYFIKKYKLHIFWIVITLFEVAMLMFTLSRAGIIAFMITAIFLIIYMFFKYHHKLSLLLNFVLGILVVSTIAYFFKDYFISIWERLEIFGLDDNGRVELWREAWSKFINNPLFGAGLFARELANELRMYHNTILHILACFGAIGGVALIVQFFSVIRIFFYKLTQEKAILLIALIGANLHGMVDNIYLMPQFMIILFIILAVVENANKIDKLRKELVLR